MDKKYLAKIIATDNEGLQMISACSAGAKVKVSDIKYLAANKVFLLSIERTKIETDQEDKKINSICRFDFVDKVKSKNIDQKNEDLVLELIAIDYLKNKDDYEIQIAYTEITRDKYGEPVFRDFELQVDEEIYFYPASTVKLPVAILALQKIRKLQSQGIPLTPDTPFTVLFSENIIKKTEINICKVNLTCW